MKRKHYEATSGIMYIKKGLPLAQHIFVVALFLGILALSLLVINELGNTIQDILSKMSPALMQKDYISYFNYYWFALLATTLFLIACFVIIVKRLTTKCVVRDYNYIKNTLSSKNDRMPITTLNDLTSHIVGDKVSANSRICKQAKATLLNNITPIISFLSKPAEVENILCVNSAWGTGKTTNVLVSIDHYSSQQNNDDIRYIYESAFKYVALVDSYEVNLLAAIQSVLYEYKIRSAIKLPDIVGKIDFERSKLLSSMLKTSFNHRQEYHLASDVIEKINREYIKKGSNFTLVIILDDLDRLQGEDAIKALSLVSIIRRFKFVKIIIPIDPSAMVYHLNAINIYNPSTFLQKYLPECNSVNAQSTMKIVEEIILNKINSLQKRRTADANIFRPAWGAILFRLISATLNENSTKWKNYRFRWTHVNNLTNTFNTNSVDPDSRRIFERSNTLMQVVMDKERSNRPHNETFPQYIYPNSHSLDARHFERILLSIDRAEGSGLNQRYAVASNFNKEHYDNLINSWLFYFAEENWEILKITLRDSLDLVKVLSQKKDFTILSKDPEEQFCQIFNQLFPKTKITLSEKPSSQKSSIGMS